MKNYDANGYDFPEMTGIPNESGTTVKTGKADILTGDGLSITKYNLIIGATLLWGFLANIIICLVTRPFVTEMNYIPFLIAYVVLGLIGTLMFSKSNNPVVSFIGYNLLVLPLGFILSFFTFGFDEYLILSVFLMTAAVTLTMVLLSLVFPRVFLSIARALGLSLFIVLLFSVILILVAPQYYSIIDGIVCLIFCGYIGYDWAVAQKREKTVDAAIDSAAALYMDIINLFIRLLSIAGRRSRHD